MQTNQRSNRGVVLPTLADAALESKSLATCAHFFSLTGLEDVLRGPGPYTVFAPTDEAFRNLSAETLDALVADPARLRDLLEYHIIGGKRERNAFANGKLKTMQGTLLTAGVTDDGVTLDHANTCGTQVVCANGVLHQIDAVLMPGYTPALSAKAREDSAWSGRRAVRPGRPQMPDENWPFVAPRSAEKSAE